MAERPKIRETDQPEPRLKARPAPALELPFAPEPVDTAPGDVENAGLDRQLLALRKIVSPLLAAVMEGRRQGGEDTSVAAQVGPFTDLIATTIALTHDLQPLLEGGNANAATRWQAACGLAEIVAAHFRATGEPLQAAEAGPLIAALNQAVQDALGTMAPTLDAAGRIDGLAQSYRSLAPAAAAVARFSFGCDTVELIEEITVRLTTGALAIASRLAAGGEAGEIVSSPLYHAILNVAGEFYLESHLSEMDRLLEMTPEDRNEYVKEHARRIPMEPVWESLELKLAMMEVVAAHLPQAEVRP